MRNFILSAMIIILFLFSSWVIAQPADVTPKGDVTPKADVTPNPDVTPSQIAKPTKGSDVLKSKHKSKKRKTAHRGHKRSRKKY